MKVYVRLRGEDFTKKAYESENFANIVCAQVFFQSVYTYC